MELRLADSGLPFRYGKIQLRLMTRDDVDDMAAWPYHLDPFYSRGVRLPTTASGRDRWWDDHHKGYYSTLLGAEDLRGRLVGRVSVTLVEEAKKEGVMGIRIRPELENLGYGTDLLWAFLCYWFILRDMEALAFDANVLNKRAIACYKKVGIKVVGYHYDYHPHFLREKLMHPSGFLKYLDFRITRSEFMELKAKKDSLDHQPV